MNMTTTLPPKPQRSPLPLAPSVQRMSSASTQRAPPPPLTMADDLAFRQQSPPLSLSAPSGNETEEEIVGGASSQPSSTTAAAGSAATTAAGTKPKKVRKRTYYMRKEEKEVLLAKLREMETRMAFFREREELMEQWKQIRRQQRDNRVLRSTIRSQRLVLANTRCMLAQSMNVTVVIKIYMLLSNASVIVVINEWRQQEQENKPFETNIKLGINPTQRRATLLAMKQEKLDDAITFLIERGRTLDHSKPFTDAQRFENVQGDYCSIRFDVTPFEGLQSAKQVFDTYLNFAFNMEINITEVLGDITIREDDDIWGSEGVAHHRMVSTISNLVQLDINSAIFSEFYHDRNTHIHDHSSPNATTTTGELGVMVFDFVNDDELYPYRPNERVRQDVTCLVVISSFRRKKFQNDPKKAPNSFHNSVLHEEDELVVVMMRWALLKVHKTDFYIPEEIQTRIKRGIEQVSDSIITAIRQAVYASQPQRQQPHGQAQEHHAPPPMSR